ILLGLARDGEGVAAQVLAKVGADYWAVRRALAALLERSPLPATVNPLPERLRAPQARPFTVQAMSRRCSFCLRSEERVARIVRGPAGRICDECLGRGAALVSEAGEDSPSRLRLRLRQPASKDFEETLVLVER